MWFEKNWFRKKGIYFGFMGLMIHSLGELPKDLGRDYFIYLLDYGWKEPIGEAVLANFEMMSQNASKNNAVVLRGTVGSHFADEVLSWHHVNSIPAEEILLAILITTRNPHDFRNPAPEVMNYPLLIIPLRSVCSNATEVVELINNIFKSIKEKKELSGFEVAKKMKRGIGGAIVDAIILKPSLHGIGIDIKALSKKLFIK